MCFQSMMSVYVTIIELVVIVGLAMYFDRKSDKE